MSDEHDDSEPVERSTLTRTAGPEDDSLDGELPPDGSDHAESTQEAAEAAGEQRPSQRSIPWVLAKWGPWRRFTWYRDMRREERDHFWRKRDPEENKRGRLPSAERVQVPAIWVAELYTPSNIDGLLRGIANLGWEHGRSRDDSLLKWMSDVRQGRRAGWTSLGLVSHPKETHFMRERTAPLPEGVRAALPILMSLTPSITALVMAFMMDDEVSDALDEPLRTYYATRTERSRLFRRRHLLSYVLLDTPMRFSWSIHHPDLQRRAAVRSCLGGLERDCVRWIRRNLPGVFASGLRDRMSPTAILLVTDVAAPAREEARSIRAFDGLSIDRDYDAWASEEWPGVRLVLPRSWDEEGLRLTFACRRHDAFPDRRGYHDPASNWTIAQRADRLIRGLLSRWALTCMLDGYHEQLSDLRDRSAAPQTYRPVQDLKKLRSLAHTKLYDIVTSAQEIEQFVDADGLYRHDVLEMKYVRSAGREQMDLIGRLRSSQRNRAQQVRREANLLQSLLSVSSEVSQTIANIRIQRLVVILIVVSIGIALFA